MIEEQQPGTVFMCAGLLLDRKYLFFYHPLYTCYGEFFNDKIQFLCKVIDDFLVDLLTDSAIFGSADRFLVFLDFALLILFDSDIECAQKIGILCIDLIEIVVYFFRGTFEKGGFKCVTHSALDPG